MYEYFFSSKKRHALIIKSILKMFSCINFIYIFNNDKKPQKIKKKLSNIYVTLDFDEIDLVILSKYLS